MRLGIGMAMIAAMSGCGYFSESPTIEGTWTCTTTNHLSGQTNQDRFVFKAPNALTMDGSMPMYGTYELAGKSLTLTVLKIPAMANFGRSTDVRISFKGSISNLSRTDLVLDTLTDKGTQRTSLCKRSTPAAPESERPSGNRLTDPPATPAGQALANPAMPALPAKSADPRPLSAESGFPNLAVRKGIGIFELIGLIDGLEERINNITRDKASVFFARLTGPGIDIAPAGTDGVFGTACMAHSCPDSAALFVRTNGAVAAAFVDASTNDLFYFSNIDQNEGIPESVRRYVEDAMKESPGLTLHGIHTTNGVSRVPPTSAGAARAKQAPAPTVEARQPPKPPQSGSKDYVARYADSLAEELERSSHPACRALATTIRSFGNSGAPDHVRQRQVDAIIEKAPTICVGG